MKYMGQFQEIHRRKLVEMGKQLYQLDTPSLPLCFSLLSLGCPCDLAKKSCA